MQLNFQASNLQITYLFYSSKQIEQCSPLIVQSQPAEQNYEKKQLYKEKICLRIEGQDHKNSQKIYQLLSKAQGRQQLRILLHHSNHRFWFLWLQTMLWIMHKVASGAEFTILMLVEIAAHLLPKCGLVHHKLLKPMCEEAVVSIDTVTGLSKTFAEFQLSLIAGLRSRFVIENFRGHDQKAIILFCFSSMLLKKDAQDLQQPCIASVLLLFSVLFTHII